MFLHMRGLHFKIFINCKFSFNLHCVKIVCIRRCSGSYFPAFGLNRECGKMRTRITLNTDTFYAVLHENFPESLELVWKNTCEFLWHCFKSCKSYNDFNLRDEIFLVHSVYSWSHWKKYFVGGFHCRNRE